MVRILVTGSDGYIGTMLTPMLRDAGHEVVGLDSCLFRTCSFGEDTLDGDMVRMDVRDVEHEDLVGFDAVVHLAAISNDPLGDLNPQTTFEINHEATIELAEKARAAGISRFVFSSSCSLYGAQGDVFIDESGTFNPITPYGVSKARCERDLHAIASDEFSPTYLRNATVYGASPRLRGDLVVNNLTGYAFATGKVFLKSDGSSWRPLIHVDDVCRAFVAVIAADRTVVHDEAFNVGATEENYQIREVAEMVHEAMPECAVAVSDEAFDDPRNYRVDCDKLASVLPEATPQWTVRAGIEQLFSAYREHGLRLEDLEGDRFMRVRHIGSLIAAGRIDERLRWVADGGR